MRFLYPKPRRRDGATSGRAHHDLGDPSRHVERVKVECWADHLHHPARNAVADKELEAKLLVSGNL